MELKVSEDERRRPILQKQHLGHMTTPQRDENFMRR
jgi:hypothetical protein